MRHLKSVAFRVCWLAQQGSNLRPPESKSGVLPTELWANNYGQATARVAQSISQLAETANDLASALALSPGSLEHFAVLVFTHALAALFNK